MNMSARFFNLAVALIEENAIARERNRILGILRLRLPASEANHLETLIATVPTGEPDGAGSSALAGNSDSPAADRR